MVGTSLIVGGGGRRVVSGYLHAVDKSVVISELGGAVVVLTRSVSAYVMEIIN